MLHLMRQEITFTTARFNMRAFDAGHVDPLRNSDDYIPTNVKITNYADELGSFNKPRDQWFPASVVDTAVALLTGEVGLRREDAWPDLGIVEGDTFTADDTLPWGPHTFIAAPVRNPAVGTVTVVRAILHNFTARQIALINARVWGKPQDAAPAVIDTAPVEQAPPVESAGPVTVRRVGPATAVIVGPGFQGGVRRHPTKPRAFEVLTFGATAEESKVIGTATTYAKTGALLAQHHGQPDLPVVVERAASANAA